MKPLPILLLLLVSARAAAHPGHSDGVAASVFSFLAASTKSAGKDDTTPEVSITVEGVTRIIRSNGLPDHEPGAFPNRGNPHRISAQSYEFRMTTTPKEAAKPTPGPGAWFGVAVNGVPFEPGSWFALFAPAKTPPAIIARLNAELNRMLADKEVQDRMRSMGLTPTPGDVESFQAVQRKDIETWTRIVKASNIKID